jgi:hypothetical protein
MSYLNDMPSPDDDFDPTRAAELFHRFAYRVQAGLAREYFRADAQMVADAVVDAVLLLARRDKPVDESTLYRTARIRLRTRLRAEARRQNRERIACETVTEMSSAAPSVLEELAERELYRRWHDRVAHTDHEKAVLELWLNGYIHPDDLARRTGLPEGEIQAILNRIRQRFLRERRRNAGGR